MVETKGTIDEQQFILLERAAQIIMPALCGCRDVKNIVKLANALVKAAGCLDLFDEA